MKILSIVLFLAACGGGKTNPGGADAPSGADARVFMDAPPSVPAMLTIGGTAFDNMQSGSTPLAGVAISLKNRADDMTLATAISDAQGKYSMQVTTGGHVVDAYVLATKSGYVDAAAYPARPFQADAPKADSNLVTTGSFNLLGIYTGQKASKGIAIVEILDASGSPVQGAAANSSPAAEKYLYSDSNGTPASGTGTNTDGVAFLVNIEPGSVVVDATKSGATFKSHTISAKANTFTSTVLTE